MARDPNAMYESGEISPSNRRSSILNKFNSATDRAGDAARNFGSSVYRNTMTDQAPELVRSHREAASSIFMGGPYGSLFVKGLANRLGNPFGIGKGSKGSNYSNYNLPYEDKGREAISNEIEEIEEVFHNDDGSQTKRKTKIRNSGKKQHITYAEKISNRNPANSMINKGGIGSGSVVRSGGSGDTNPMRRNNLENYNRYGARDGLSKSDLSFITHLSKSVAAQLEKSEEKRMSERTLGLFGKVGILTVLPSVSFLNIARYSTQLPNAKKVGVLNAINVTLGMLYSASRVNMAETNRLLYDLALITRQGLDVQYRIKRPAEVTTASEQGAKLVRAIVKSPWSVAKFGLRGLGILDTPEDKSPTGGLGRGAGGQGGSNNKNLGFFDKWKGRLKKGAGIGVGSLLIASLLGINPLPLLMGIGSAGLSVGGALGGLVGSGGGLLSSILSTVGYGKVLGAGLIGTTLYKNRKPIGDYLRSNKTMGFSPMENKKGIDIPPSKGSTGNSDNCCPETNDLLRAIIKIMLNKSETDTNYQNRKIFLMEDTLKAKTDSYNDNLKFHDKQISLMTRLVEIATGSKQQDLEYHKLALENNSNIIDIQTKSHAVHEEMLETTQKEFKETDWWRKLQLTKFFGGGMLNAAGSIISGIVKAIGGALNFAFDNITKFIGMIPLAIAGGLATGVGGGGFLAAAGLSGAAIAGFKSSIFTKLKGTALLTAALESSISGYDIYGGGDIGDALMTAGVRGGSTIGGMAIGGMVGSIGGPPGIIVGSVIGSIVGYYLGDLLSGIWKDSKSTLKPTIEHFADEVVLNFDMMLFGFRHIFDIIHQAMDTTINRAQGLFNSPVSQIMEWTRTRGFFANTLGRYAKFRDYNIDTGIGWIDTPWDWVKKQGLKFDPLYHIGKTSLHGSHEEFVAQRDLERSTQELEWANHYKNRAEYSQSRKDQHDVITEELTGKTSFRKGEDGYKLYSTDKYGNALEQSLYGINPEKYKEYLESQGQVSEPDGNWFVNYLKGLYNSVMGTNADATNPSAAYGTSEYFNQDYGNVSGYSSGYIGQINAPPQYQESIAKYSKQFGVHPNLVAAIIKAESNWQPNAISSAGAQGLMQLMPGTAGDMGVTNAFDPDQNIMGGTQYISKMLKMFNGDLPLALAAYNAGPGNVRKHGGIPPFRETQAYVPKVLGYFTGNDKFELSDLGKSGIRFENYDYNPHATWFDEFISNENKVDYVKNKFGTWVDTTKTYASQAKKWGTEKIEGSSLSIDNMKDLLKEKIEAHPELKEHLEKTGLTIDEFINSKETQDRLEALRNSNAITDTLNTTKDRISSGLEAVGNQMGIVASNISVMSSNVSNATTALSESISAREESESWTTDGLPPEVQMLLFAQFD